MPVRLKRSPVISQLLQPPENNLFPPMQAKNLTPAQQAMRRKDKRGNPFEFLQMVISLVKRW